MRSNQISMTIGSCLFGVVVTASLVFCNIWLWFVALGILGTCTALHMWRAEHQPR